MAKEVDLLSYWMPILRELKEFKEIANTEEVELTYLLEAIDNTLNNMFIETADENGIKRFEDMMGIYPDEEADLDLRRINVQLKWNNTASYTDKELYNSLLMFCGSEDNFSIVNNYEEYLIDITTGLGVRDSFDTVTKFLKEVLPCNLVINLKNVLKETSVTPVNIIGVTTTAKKYTIN